MLGSTRSEASKAKQSASRMGVPRGPHSDATKAKMRAAALGRIISPEAREKMRLAKLGKPGPWLGKGCGPMSGRHHSEAAKDKIRQSQIGKKPYRPSRSFPYNGIEFRSSYESRVAQSLDLLGVPWAYEPRTFRMSNGRGYTPDFYLPEDDCYWEVKGYFSEASQQKAAWFREHVGVPLVVFTKTCVCNLERQAQLRTSAQ